jgi:eukaryotic-like serine/threonine-protein kinase
MGLKIVDAGYRIIEPIASGGMGDVYKAEHVITKRVEAIKVLSGAGTEEQTDRFLREIQLQASLSHPNIAAVYNAFRFEDNLVMVMELVGGESLRDLLARGPLTIPLAVDYARQVLAAMGYAHEHGVIHRDITPSNIVITPQGIVKLMDFGLAKASASPSASQSGAYMGSPHYMSPEQVKDAMRASPRSDIYSLGAVLYEMVTGSKVFASAGDSSFAVMQAQVESVPKPPVEINAAIPATLNAAILTALDKDPERRFPNADAFRRAIEAPGQAIAVASRALKKSRPVALARAFQFAAAVALILLPLGLYEARRPRRELKLVPPSVHAAPAAPVAVDPTPPVIASPEPAVNPPSLRPTRKRAVKRTSKPDLTPRVVGEERRPAAPRRIEPVQPAATLSPPSPSRPAPEPVAAASVPTPDAPAVAKPSQPENGAAAAGEEATATPKDKKAHGRFRRTLGKIFSPFH